jgi:hypothetical protein
VDPRVEAGIAFPPRYANDAETVASRTGNLSAFGSTPKAASALTGITEAEARSKLSLAFAAIDNAEAFCSRVQAASDELDRRRSKAYRKVERAEAGFEKAREASTPASVSQAILSGEDLGPSPIRAAKQKLVEAEAEFGRLHQLRLKLEAEQREGERQLSLATRLETVPYNKSSR